MEQGNKYESGGNGYCKNFCEGFDGWGVFVIESHRLKRRPKTVNQMECQKTKGNSIQPYSYWTVELVNQFIVITGGVFWNKFHIFIIHLRYPKIIEMQA